jgi:hypothetical protein
MAYRRGIERRIKQTLKNSGNNRHHQTALGAGMARGGVISGGMASAQLASRAAAWRSRCASGGGAAAISRSASRGGRGGHHGGMAAAQTAAWRNAGAKWRQSRQAAAA